MHCKSVRNLWPPHTPVVAICPLSFTIICSHAPPPSKKKKKEKKEKKRETISACISVPKRTHKQIDTYSMQIISIVGIAIGFAPSIHMITEIKLFHYHIHLPQPFGHCCHLFPYRIHPTFLQMTGIIINYPLWITIRQEYYTSFEMCH